MLERYWPAVTPGRHPVLVLSVGFWEKSAEVPEVRAPGLRPEDGWICTASGMHERCPQALLSCLNSSYWHGGIRLLGLLVFVEHSHAVVPDGLGATSTQLHEQLASRLLQEYLAMLTELAQKVERVFFVGLPTGRVCS